MKGIVVKYTSIPQERAAEYSRVSGLKKTLKKVEKTFQKGIDKSKALWYNNKVVAKRRRQK